MLDGTNNSSPISTRIVELICNPYNNIFISVLVGLASCFSLLWFYYPNDIDPSLAASEFSTNLSSPAFLNACLVTISIGSLLLLDLIMDISVFLIEYRTIQLERKKSTIDHEKRIDQMNEFLVRSLYIISVLVASITLWTGKPAYRCLLGFFAIRFRNIFLFGVCMFTVVDTFRQHGNVLKLLCLACSMTYSIAAFASMISRFQGHPIGIESLILQSIPIVTAGLLLLYLWTLLIRRARNAYSKDTATLSVKELTFMVYSMATLATITITFYSRKYTALENSTVEILLSRECVIIATTVAWALLPARIARSHAKISQNRWMNAKRDVTTLLNSPLKVATSELDDLLYDSEVSRLLPNDYTTRLARVAIACNSTIMKLTSIAEEKEEDGVSDSNSSGGMMGENDDYISHSTSQIMAFRGPRRQRQIGHGTGLDTQRPGLASWSKLDQSLSSLTNGPGIRDITIHFHKDHDQNVDSGSNGGGHRMNRQNGNNMGSNPSDFNLPPSDREGHDISYSNDPTNVARSWHAGRGLLTMSLPCERDFDRQEGVLHSESSITNSEYQDGHNIPHNHDQFVLPHTRSTLRIKGGLTSLLSRQSSQQPRRQPPLQSQLPLPLQIQSSVQLQLPTDTSQYVQTHCGTHSPPSYVDSHSISVAPLPADGGGGGSSSGGGGGGSHVSVDMSDVSHSNSVSLQTPHRPAVEHDLWPDRISNCGMSSVSGTDATGDYRMQWLNRVQLSLSLGLFRGNRDTLNDTGNAVSQKDLLSLAV